MPNTEIIVEMTTQSPSTLPKDKFVNVWHFLDVAPAASLQVANTAFKKIWDFVMTPGGTGPTAVAAFLEANLDGVVKLTAYDRAAATPRPELAVATFDKGAAGSIGMPEEVALCISYYTDRNLPSKRGRLYIGPLNIGALNALVSAPVRPKASFVSAMAEAGGRMKAVGPPAAAATFISNSAAAAGTSAATAWALFSPKLGTYAAITAGWVDDEWDGQSRRRVEATTRTLY